MRIFLSKEKDIKKLVVTRENRAHSNARAKEYARMLLGLYLSDILSLSFMTS